MKSGMRLTIFAVAFLALLLVPSSAANSSLEVFLDTWGKNVTIVEKNVTQPGFLPGELGYQVSGDSASSILYLQSVVDDANATKTTKRADADTPTPFVIESLKVKATPSSTCHPFLMRQGAKATFPVSILPGPSNSIGITVNYNCSHVGLANITFSLAISNLGNTSQTLHFEISKEVASHRLGLNMGTFLTLADVAFDGKVLSDWAPASHTVQVSAGVLSSPFNIWLNKAGERQVIRSVSLTANPPHCAPTLEGGPSQNMTIGQMPSLVVRSPKIGPFLPSADVFCILIANNPLISLPATTFVLILLPNPN